MEGIYITYNNSDSNDSSDNKNELKMNIIDNEEDNVNYEEEPRTPSPRPPNDNYEQKYNYHFIIGIILGYILAKYYLIII